MSLHRSDGRDEPSWALYLARGKTVSIERKHAADGMAQDDIDVEDVTLTLDAPDHDKGTSAFEWVRKKTIIVRYTEYEEKILVRSVSATRRRLYP